MTPPLQARLSPLVLFVLLGGCGSGGLREQVVRLQAENRVLHSQVRDMKAQIQELDHGMHRALCRPDIKQLVDELFKECGSNDVCPGTKVQTALNDVLPGHKSSLIRFMTSLGHVVFYLNSGVTALAKVREKALASLVQERLPGTNFLIVVEPTAGITPLSRARQEAQQRALFIREKLRENYVDDAKIRIWSYEIPIREQEISNLEDRPRFPETTKELSRGVWLFRIDC